MGIARDFTGKIAYLARAEDPEIYSDMALCYFDGELTGRHDNSKKRHDNPLDRMRPVFAFKAFGYDKGRTDYLWCLGGILLLSNLKYAHDEPQHDHAIFELQVVAAESAGKYPDIDAVLTAEKAASKEVAENWD